jgi:hypothetical protein
MAYHWGASWQTISNARNVVQEGLSPCQWQSLEELGARAQLAYPDARCGVPAVGTSQIWFRPFRNVPRTVPHLYGFFSEVLACYFRC